MPIRERAAVGARGYNADELRQKLEWLAKSAVNRIREDLDSEKPNDLHQRWDLCLARGAVPEWDAVSVLERASE